MNHSLLKMNLHSMEKSLSSLYQKGRRSLVHCTSHTKASPKHSCSPMDVSSGLVLTGPLKKLFGNVKHTWNSRPRMLLHHSHQHLPLWHPWQICASDIFTLDGVDYLIISSLDSKLILIHNLPVGQSHSAKVIHILEEWFCDHSWHTSSPM